jgi:uncharacterized cupin superfamily protein
VFLVLTPVVLGLVTVLGATLEYPLQACRVARRHDAHAGEGRRRAGSGVLRWLMKPFVNIAEVDTFASGEPGTVFAARHGMLARPLGSSKIGASVTRVQPGHAAFPLHHHHGSEEHFFIVSGAGTLRHGGQTYAVKAGDYIVHPPGGPEQAHQLINTGTEPLVYLAIGAMVAPEVVGYPDSGKVGVMARPFGEKGLRFFAKNEDIDKVSYWEGEDGAKVRSELAKHGK